MSNAQHEALRKFSYQISFALSHYNPHGLSAATYNNIIIGGLGGSGIGGRIVKSLFANSCPVPVECIADYGLPAYVNEKSLVILGSYSGNTEETLQMFEETLKRGSKILVLTSGGKLAELASANHLHQYHIEPGFQPRMALGFSLTYLIQIFNELTGKSVQTGLENIASLFENNKPYEDEAMELFEVIKPKVKSKVVVLTDGPLEPIGIRFAQQVQENAKHECFQHSLPEMNHNVIESYYGQLDTVFIMLDSMQNERVTSRFEFLNSLLAVEYNKVIHMELADFTYHSIYKLIHRLDWLSLFIADHRKVDSLNVPNIASLKEFLENA
jgi:glucose/mannose-6-phosphate isomerase